MRYGLFMANIQVSAKPNDSGWTVAVTVHEDDSETRHTVSVSKSDYENLTEGKVAIGKLISSSFEFLLERESKESILSAFDIMTIAQYFPNYPSTIRQRLGI